MWVVPVSYAIDPTAARSEQAEERVRATAEPAATRRQPAERPVTREEIVTPPVDGYWQVTGNDAIAVFADQTTVRRDRELTRMWTVWVNRDIASAGDRYSQVLMEFECRGRSARLAQISTYSAMGESLVSENGTEGFSVPVPGTIFYHLTEAGCSDFREWPTRLAAARLQGVSDLVSWSDTYLFQQSPTTLQQGNAPQASRIGSALHRELTARVSGYLDITNNQLPRGRTVAPGGQDHVAALQPGGEVTIDVSMQQGVTYYAIGACDDDCKGLILEVLDATRHVVARDARNADFPRVRYTPSVSGAYQVRVILESCGLAPCYVGGRILQ
ncbi:surface-adhesin E family protein [Candidatus Viadribacter manganicus]